MTVIPFPSARSANAPERPEPTWQDALRKRRVFTPGMWVIVMVVDEDTKMSTSHVLEGWIGLTCEVRIGANFEDVSGSNWVMVDDRLPLPDNITILPLWDRLNKRRIVTRFLHLPMCNVGIQAEATRKFIHDVNDSFGADVDAMTDEDDPEPPLIA